MKVLESAEFLSLANDDMESAEFLKTKTYPNNNAIYYNYARAFEKYLKSFLVLNDLEPTSNHKFTIDLKFCEKKYPDFVNLLKEECNHIYKKSLKLTYKKNKLISDNDISDIEKSIKKLINTKEYESVFSSIIEKYGKEWENKLFNKINNNTIVLLNPIKCCTKEKEYKNLNNEELKMEYFSIIGDGINKVICKDINNKKYYILEREENKILRRWYFENNFNDKSAFEYLKQYDNQNNK